jgi:opacity protein-like surface antigen
MKSKALAAVAACLAMGGIARAEGIGARIDSIQAGAGVSDFAGEAASSLTKLGAEWDLRLGLRTSAPFGVEIGYVGTTHPVNNVMAPLTGGGDITSNGIEGLARFNFTLHSRWEPFAFAGVGIDHWSLSGATNPNPEAIKGSDNSLAIPFGAGVNYPLAQHWDLDGRFTYRAQLLDEMLRTNAVGQPNAGAESLANWTATARLGYLF